MFKTKFFIAIVLVFAVAACEPANSTLSDKKKKSDSEFVPRLAKKVHELKSGTGLLSCSGYAANADFVRTRLTFRNGTLEHLKVESFDDKKNPQVFLNDLSPNLRDYQVYSVDLKEKILQLELDLDGKKFEVEAFAEMNGKARKVYELDFVTAEDGEGDYALNGYLTFKDTNLGADLSEVFMGCAVLPLP